tara:strand:+ start:94 stop:558 length:465 start_codon:yes stop_codon:yes gene_type:complete
MAITPPNFQKDAIPTPQGWKHPRTNELLVARKITREQIDEYYGVKPEPQMLKESPTTVEETKEELYGDITEEEDSLESKTKLELEAIGREHGIELDRRKNKDDLIEELQEAMSEEDLESKTKVELEAIGREHGVELDRREKKTTLIEKLKGIIN